MTQMAVELVKRKEPVGEFVPQGVDPDLFSAHWLLGMSCGTCGYCLEAAADLETSPDDVECWVLLHEWDGGPERIDISDSVNIAVNLYDICPDLMCCLYEISVTDLLASHTNVGGKVDA